MNEKYREIEHERRIFVRGIKCLLILMYLLLLWVAISSGG